MKDRRDEIIGIVREKGFAAIDMLARHFDVTPQTIRRDINTLAAAGVLHRHHGGAGLPSSVENVAYETRRVVSIDEKQRIARLVADQIPNGTSLFINIGTTTEAVAAALENHQGLQVITNNLNVASMLSSNPLCEVIVAGGIVRNRDRGIVGEAALAMISQFKVDIGVIGISGIDADGSLLDYDYREVQVAKAIIANSRRVFLAADHTKTERNALVCLGHVNQVDVWFTDRPPPTKLAKIARDAGVEILVAEQE